MALLKRIPLRVYFVMYAIIAVAVFAMFNQSHPDDVRTSIILAVVWPWTGAAALGFGTALFISKCLVLVGL